MKEFYITASDGLELSVAEFEEENPKAVIQIIHGAMEHKERYYPFMDYLAEDPKPQTWRQAKEKQAHGLNEWDDGSPYGIE